MQSADQGQGSAVAAIVARPAANDAAGPHDGWLTTPGAEAGWDPYEVWRRCVRDVRGERPGTER